MKEIKFAKGNATKLYQDSVTIRKAVFVKEQAVPEELEIDDAEAKCTYFVLYIEQKAVATARIFATTDNGIHVQRVAVLKNYRERHFGSELLKYIINYAKKNEFNYVILGAQDHAQPFYQRLGFQVFGPQYEEVGILHHDMKLNL